MNRAIAVLASLTLGALLWGQAPALPVIREFEAVPQSSVPGVSVVLVWAVDGADSVSITFIGSVPPSGTVTISPTTTTTYTLTAKSAAGQVFAVTTFRVGAVPLTGTTVSPQQLSFFDVVVGKSADLVVFVRLLVFSDVRLSIVNSPAGSPFSIVGPTSLSAQSLLRVTVRFSPSQPGVVSANLRIDVSGTAIADSIPVPLTGGGVPSEDSVAVTGFSNIANPADRVAADTWVAIYGRNLASTTRSWTAPDFVDGHCPTSLDGVSVLIDGHPAYVSYVSPSQINVLTPGSFANMALARTPKGTANPIQLGGQPYLPQFFGVPDQFRYAVATLPDGAYVGPTGMLGASVVSRPVRPGESIALYLTGAGPAMPLFQEGVFTAPAPVSRDIYFVLQGQVVRGDYLIEIGPGVYQAGLTLPSIPAGDTGISFVLGNAASEGGFYLAVGDGVE